MFGTENNQNGERGTRDIDSRLKKAVIIILAGMTAFVVIGYAAIQLLDFEAWSAPSDTEKHPNTIIFSTPDYDEDIYKDEIYMGLDRHIYIYDINTGLKESMSAESYKSYDDGVQLMYDLVNAIIEGNVERYNSFFAHSEYHDESFTKQKLYNIVITSYGAEEYKVDGETWTQYEFALEYMIRQNNGTLRLDLESDASRAQYITLSDRSGELLIESVRFPIEK